MNKIQVNLDNFQSIKEAELEFVQGINVIVGQSNSGKSATLRAIKGAVLNTKGAQRYIKHGESNLSVNIQYQDNNITWSRTGKDSKYNINGEEYQKVGNSNLPKILDKSGFVVDENNKLMNVEGELELPFPFDKNPTDLFKLFEKSIFCVSDSALVLKVIKADEDTAKKEISEAKYELDRYKGKLNAIEDLESEIDLSKLREGKINLEELYFQVEKMQSSIEQVVKGIKAGEKLKLTKNEVELIDLSEYNSLLNNVKRLELAKEQLNVLKQYKGEITFTIDLEKYNRLTEDVKRLEKISELLSKTKQLKPPEIKESLSDYIKLLKDFKTLGRLFMKCKGLKADIEDMQNKQNTLQEQLKEYKICPLCGKEL